MLLLLAACARPTPPALGQWVWTMDDLAPLSSARASRTVTAGVHVATVRFQNGVFENTLALAPTVAGPGPAVVIRLDDDVHAAWATLDDAAMAEGLGGALGRVLALVHTRVVPAEVQLDYDVPVRLLPRWAAVLGRLRAGPLQGETLWITSLVSHLEQSAYGGLFRGVVAGHLLQVFDTGDGVGSAASVAALADRADLPYRLGLGAFERANTNHRAWFAEIGVGCVAPRCEGVWVFPAGQAWSALILEQR